MIARCLGIAVGLVGLSIVIGCSGDGLDPRYSVTGTVKYKGQNLTKGKITFTPESETGRGATGTIEDGSYTLTTNEPGDGAFPGKYKVTIADVVIDRDALRAAMLKPSGKGGNGADPSKIAAHTVDEALVGKMSRKAKNNVPTKYSSTNSSDLKAEVKEQSNTINFDLND